MRALSMVFRAKFCEGLQALYAAGNLQFHGQLQPLSLNTNFQALMRQATRHAWNLHLKRPFAGPAQVLRYLSRYTHRVAISSGRLQRLDLELQTVTFTYKDYADHDRLKPLELSLQEFLRRFCLHLLPQRFVKIRHYGLLANSHRHQRLALARQLLGITPPTTPTDPAPAAEPTPITASTPLICPNCRQRTLILVGILGPTPRPAVLDSS